MTLEDLKPRLDTDEKTGRKYLIFNCPCSRFSDKPEDAMTHCFGRIRLPIRFQGDPPASEKPTWDAFGELPELSLSPSVLIYPTGDPKGSYCAGWHGYITVGEMKPC